MKTLAARALAFVVGVSAVGCGESELIQRCEDIVSPIHAAALAPSGKLTPITAQRLLTRLYGSGGAITVPDDVPPSCVTGDNTEDYPRLIDMACATNGAMMGNVSTKAEEDGDDVYVFVTYEGTCIIGKDFCMNGTGAFVFLYDEDLNDYSYFQANDVEVTRKGLTESEKFGFVKELNGVAGTVHFLGDQSYLIDPQPDIDLEGESTVWLFGSNGDFFCSFTDLGVRGSCRNGDTGEEFNW